MCVRETTFEDESYEKTTNKHKRLSPRKKSESHFHTLNSTFVVLVSHHSLSVVIPNFKRKRKRKRVQPERREHHALTRIINTKGRVDRDSLYIYVIIVPDNNNNNTINTIDTTTKMMIMMMLRV
jgi:hypothetical protein